MLIMFSWSALRSGTSAGCLMSMTLSRLERSEMQPLRSWPVRPEWRWRYGSRTRSTIWTSMYPAKHLSLPQRSHCSIGKWLKNYIRSFFFLQYCSCIPSSIRSLSLFTLLSCSVRIIELNGGQSPLTYKRFQTLISRMDAVETPAEAITAEVMGSCTTPLSDDHDEKFGVPSLEELGVFLVLLFTCRLQLFVLHTRAWETSWLDSAFTVRFRCQNSLNK